MWSRNAHKLFSHKMEFSRDWTYDELIVRRKLQAHLFYILHTLEKGRESFTNGNLALKTNICLMWSGYQLSKPLSSCWNKVSDTCHLRKRDLLWLTVSVMVGLLQGRNRMAENDKGKCASQPLTAKKQRRKEKNEEWESANTLFWVTHSVTTSTKAHLLFSPWTHPAVNPLLTQPRMPWENPLERPHEPATFQTAKTWSKA